MDDQTGSSAYRGAAGEEHPHDASSAVPAPARAESTPDAPDSPTALGSVPPPGPPGGSPTGSWVMEIWVDPDWYAMQSSPDPLPQMGPPLVLSLLANTLLIGRSTRTGDIQPDIDCNPDTSASRQQAELTFADGQWWVEDLDSSNGTYVTPAHEPLPTTPVEPGVRHPLGPDDHILVGAWTRMIIRRDEN